MVVGDDDAAVLMLPRASVATLIQQEVAAVGEGRLELESSYRWLLGCCVGFVVSYHSSTVVVAARVNHYYYYYY